MIKLLINKPAVDSLDKTSFGGLPVKGKNSEFVWPTCKSCKGNMQFLGKIATEDKVEQIFMCQNEPGLCDEWGPDGGGNVVFVETGSDLEKVPSPDKGETFRNTEYGSVLENFESESYDNARAEWAEKNNVSPREVLGQIFGEPAWMQNDETPKCDGCKNPMRFVAQLEQGPDWQTEMNFGGGGCAYLFDCTCEKSAKFLWQC